MKPWISAFIHSNFSSYAQILQNLSRCYIGIYFPFSRHLCTDFQSQVLSLELLFLRNYIICNSRLLVLSCMHCVSYFEQHFFLFCFIRLAATKHFTLVRGQVFSITQLFLKRKYVRYTVVYIRADLLGYLNSLIIFHKHVLFVMKVDPT